MGAALETDTLATPLTATPPGSPFGGGSQDDETNVVSINARTASPSLHPGYGLDSATTFAPPTTPSFVPSSDRDPLATGLGDLMAGLPTPVAPATPPKNVRPAAITKRGKRDFNYKWPEADYAQMEEAFRAWKPIYRRYWSERAPEAAYGLVFSAFAARALQEAFKDVDAWLPTVRNDARKEPFEGKRVQVGLVWPVEVENQILDLMETLPRSRFPEGFLLTKQHLVAAAILHGLKTVEQWVLSVDNDDRYSAPTAQDRRLRENRVRR